MTPHPRCFPEPRDRLGRAPLAHGFALLLGALVVNAARESDPPWQAMDYGPFLTASIEAPQPRPNIAYKGLALNLGNNFDGEHNEAVLFDTDLLRYSAGWTGDFVALKGVVFDGEHGAYPHIAGPQVFGNPAAPGWAKGGRFQDPREFPYGPLPRDWAHWKGLYLHEKNVVLSYSVDTMSVLELPALERRGELVAFARTLNLSPATVEHVAQIVFAPDRRAEWFDPNTLTPVASSAAAAQSLVVFTAATPAAAPPGSLDQGLLGRWEFNEPGGNSAADDSGLGRTLRLNSVSWVEAGHERTGLEFDGEHFAEISGPNDFAPLDQDMSVATWINTREDGSILALTTPGDHWVPDANCLFLRGGRVTFDVGWVGALAGSSTVTDGQWHHIALTWSRADGRVALFVDGQPEGTGNLRPRQPLATPTLRVGFAAPDFPESPWFRGRIDGLRLYERALSHAEIAALAGQTPRDEVLAAAFVGRPEAANWMKTDDGHLRLRFPASTQSIRGKVLLWSGSRDALPDFAALVQSSPAPTDLDPLTRGGPPRWPDLLRTRGTLGTHDGPYAVDTLTEPDPNPWHSWMRFGGLDLFPDGRRAVLSTWNGDVWLVSGVDGDLRDLTWQRIATGLFQPLGIRIVDHRIYVLGRDQITRLHDLNGDGEADFYENFNNDCMVSEHFHEFALDLKTGPDGSFYYIKCACHGTTARHPHHGTLMRVSPDGSKLEVVARGFRANNGLGVGPRGELTSIDNQGHWMPGNRVNWIKPGGWYGYQWAWNPEHRTTYDQPLCWMHNFVDRSGGTQLWVPTDQWGPFRDEIISISYGMGHIFLLLKEEVDGQMQGAVTRFPLEFETGAMRGAWHPQTGQLYTAGLYGWAGNKTQAGGFYRVRYTGQPVHMARALHFVRDGIVLGFTDPLDPKSATDPGNYSVTAWNYQWTENYGSPDFKLNGEEGRDAWPVASATLSADRQTVFLNVPDAQRVMQLHVVYNLAFADGAHAENFVHGTIHNLSAKSGMDWVGEHAIARTEEAGTRLAQEAPGLIQTFTSPPNDGQEDTRRSRLPALFVPEASAPTPFLGAGRFRCRWEGYLKLELNDEITFAPEGRGIAVALKLNGEPALNLRDGELHGRRSNPVALRAGLNRFELEYESGPEGDAEFRLTWSSKRLPHEPIPPTAFVHDPENPRWRSRVSAREGRQLFANHRCAKCHQPTSPWTAMAMPELEADAPAFDGIGSRLQSPWIAQWLLDPRSIRPDALMPRLLAGPEATADAADIAAYLAGLREPSVPAALEPEAATATALIADGTGLFANLGCAGCHSLPGEPALTDDTRVPLSHVAAKWQPAALEAFLLAPAAHFRWTGMPDFNLAPREAAALAALVLDRTRTEGRNPGLSGPAEGAAPADAQRGGELVASLGCMNCHTLDHAQNAFRAPGLARLAVGDWAGGCLADKAATRGKAPDFAFDDGQRAALRALAKDDFAAALHRYVPAEFAERQYVALRCSACHPRDSETDVLTALASAAPPSKNPYDDEETGEGGSVHIGRPLLTYAGEKLYSGWMERFLQGTLPYKPRPELQGRMPAFGAYAAGLAAGFAQQHGYGAESAPRPQVDQDLAALGERLTGVNGGFSCVSCHNVGEQRALAGKDTATVNFACVAERLRPSYYWRYVQDPTRLVPSTMMPKFIGEDGTTPIKAVFDGDPQKQFTAIWHYLLSLRAAPARN